jgi:hypothetical protein
LPFPFLLGPLAPYRYQQTKKRHQKQRFVANWQTTSLANANRKATQRELLASQQAEQEQLDARRQKLASLLAEDTARERQQLNALQETPEQRRARLIERAQQLKERREAARRQFVEEQERRRFRENCDELRRGEGDLLVAHCTRIQGEQMSARKEQIQLDEERERLEEERIAREGEKSGHDKGDVAFLLRFFLY